MAKELAPIEIVAEKLKQGIDLLKKNDVDMWITFVQETSATRERVFDYISVSDLTWESAIIVTKSGDKLVILGRFDEATFKDSKLYTEIYSFVQDFKEPFVEVLKKYNPQKIALNYSLNDASADGITYGKFLYLSGLIKETLKECEIVSAEKIIDAIISQKTPKELDCIKEAIRITEEIFDEVKPYIKAGRTVKEIYNFLQTKMEEKKVTPSFDTLVFSGDRGSSIGHGKVTEEMVMEGDLLHIDMGVYYKGYASDLQRTFYIAKKNEKKVPDEVLKGFDTIKEAIIESGKELKPGKKGADIDKIARDYVVKKGFDEFPHALGHQIGRYVHDGGALLGPPWPRYKNTPFYELKENQVFTLEPSLMVKNFGAVGIEEDVIITEEGAKYLSHLQEELIVIKP
jgi:Xaa-Pro aminopeptidase